MVIEAIHKGYDHVLLHLARVHKIMYPGGEEHYFSCTFASCY